MHTTFITESPTTVLVIEPDDIRRKKIVRHIRGEGVEVLQARTSLEGLERILSKKPSLVISALHLEDEPAMRLVEDIRQSDFPEFQKLNFILVAPYFSATTSSSARRLGVLHCLEYDTHPEILRFIVQSCSLPPAAMQHEKAQLH